MHCNSVVSWFDDELGYELLVDLVVCPDFPAPISQKGAFPETASYARNVLRLDQ